MHEQDLKDMVAALREMATRFVDSDSGGGQCLSSQDKAAFRRTLREAKAILDADLRPANDFSMSLMALVNPPTFGVLDPPYPSDVEEAISLIEGGLNETRRKLQRRAAAPIDHASSRPPYVDPVRIGQLQALKSRWDLQRLVIMLQELNKVHASDSHMATAMLVRAIVDHVPPIFGLKTFGDVANNYASPRSFAEQMKHLNVSLRKIADSHLHQHVREKEVLPTGAQVDFRNALDVLLGEVVRLQG